MRITIDIPESLMRKAQAVSVSRNISFRTLMIEAIERSLTQSEIPYVFPDASAGKADKKPSMTAAQVNAEIDQLREGSFRV